MRLVELRCADYAVVALHEPKEASSMKVGADPAVRVLMLGPLPPPVGGMATVVANLADAFANLGPSIEQTSDPGADPEPAAESTAVFRPIALRLLNNVKTTAEGRSLWQGIAAQLRLLRRLASICIGWRPHLVHIHTCSWFSFWRSAVDLLLARVLLCPVVLHIHGAQFHRFLDSLSAPHAWLARRVFALSNRIIVLGDGWKQVLDGWADLAKVVVVPNGVPVQTPIHDPVRDLELDPIRAADAPFRIICLANYEARKGQADLLRAAARLDGRRPVQVLLFGFEAEPGQRQALLALAAELGIAERVEVPGPVTGAEKERSLRGAQCFCLPSYDEGLPMSMLEAMALALPVVVTAVGAIPEAVVDGEQGLLYPPGDIDALSAHLQTLVDDPAGAARIGWTGRERLISSFSLERSVSLLAGVYRALAG